MNENDQNPNENPTPTNDQKPEDTNQGGDNSNDNKDDQTPSYNDDILNDPAPADDKPPKKEGEDDSGEEEYDPDDKEFIDRTVEQKLAAQRAEDQARQTRERAVDDYFESEEGKLFAQHKDKVREIIHHKGLSGFKDTKAAIESVIIAREGGLKNVMTKIANMKKEADADAEKDRLGGDNDARNDQPTDRWSMSKEDFEAHLLKVKRGEK